MKSYKFPNMPPLDNGDWITIFWDTIKWEVRDPKGKLKAKGKMKKLKPIYNQGRNYFLEAS